MWSFDSSTRRTTRKKLRGGNRNLIGSFIFNVRSIAPVWMLLILHSQTELAMNTHVTVTNTHTTAAPPRRVRKEAVVNVHRWVTVAL